VDGHHKGLVLGWRGTGVLGEVHDVVAGTWSDRARPGRLGLAGNPVPALRQANGHIDVVDTFLSFVGHVHRQCHVAADGNRSRRVDEHCVRRGQLGKRGKDRTQCDREGEQSEDHPPHTPLQSTHAHEKFLGAGNFASRFDD
jgi:hypothetical protein